MAAARRSRRTRVVEDTPRDPNAVAETVKDLEEREYPVKRCKCAKHLPNRGTAMKTKATDRIRLSDGRTMTLGEALDGGLVEPLEWSSYSRTREDSAGRPLKVVQHVAREVGGEHLYWEIGKTLFESRTGESISIGSKATPNGGYYVWVMGRGNEPLDEPPAGPHDLEVAKQMARIAAQKGVHDRAVSLGVNPLSRSFRIVRRYRSHTGERTI